MAPAVFETLRATTYGGGHRLKFCLGERGKYKLRAGEPRFQLSADARSGLWTAFKLFRQPDTQRYDFEMETDFVNPSELDKSTYDISDCKAEEGVRSGSAKIWEEKTCLDGSDVQGEREMETAEGSNNQNQAQAILLFAHDLRRLPSCDRHTDCRPYDAGYVSVSDPYRVALVRHVDTWWPKLEASSSDDTAASSPTIPETPVETTEAGEVTEENLPDSAQSFVALSR